MSNRPSPPAHVVRARVDISLLQLSDRACLRLLQRGRVCTATQLSNLLYPSHRTTLRRTRQLWLKRLLNRESLPAEQGGIPVAYRLSESGRRRLHLNPYRSPSLVTVRHQLDGVEFVTGIHREERGLVQLWWPESMIPSLGDGIPPDQLVIIDTGEASALILVEVDESTERPPVIRDRLRAYAKLFEDHRVGWYLLWVANSRERLARLRQIAGSMKDAMLSGRCWGVAIDDVSDRGADAEIHAIGAKEASRPLRSIATDPKTRRSDYEVGSPAWITLIANGAIQEIGPLWHGVERVQAETAPPPADIAPVTELATLPATLAAVTVDDTAAEEPAQPAVMEAPMTTSESVAPEEPATPPEPDQDLRHMFGGELVRLILGAAGDGPRAARAIDLLAERDNVPYLLDDLQVLCRSGKPEQQLQALAVIRNLRPRALIFTQPIRSR